jgi:hypothetical protein
VSDTSLYFFSDRSNAKANSDIRFSVDNSERMRIDSSGNVGIGETLPLGKLHVKTADSGATVDASADDLVIEGSGHTGISILSGASSNGSIYFGDAGVNYDGFVTYQQGTRSMGFGTAAGTRMTIDSSGNLLVGKSVTAQQTAGTVLYGTGQIYATATSTQPMVITRKQNDGALTIFYSDSNEIGRISNSGTNFIVEASSSNRSGLNFGGGISPRYGGADVDNQVDLGAPTLRFQDVYAVNYHGNGSNLTGVGGSTTFGAVGTYTVAANNTTNSATIAAGATVAGSTFRTNQYNSSHKRPLYGDYPTANSASFSQSGTWRNMAGPATGAAFGVYAPTLWVRIS